MTRNRRLFTSYKAYDGRHLVFGSNLKGKVISEGNISHDSIKITNVEHVSGLAFNLISPLNVTFDESLPELKSSPSIEDDRINEPIVQDPVRSPSLEANASEPGHPKNVKEARGHQIEQVIGELNERTLRSNTKQA
ncbi:hypothetical protein Tco_0873207 [Tanacetum coccineum]